MKIILSTVVEVQLTSDQHGANGEDLLGVGVGRDVAKAHAGETAQGEVQRCHVGAPDRRPAAQHHPRAVQHPQSGPGAVPLARARRPRHIQRLQPRSVPVTGVGGCHCTVRGIRNAQQGGERSQEVWRSQTFGQFMEPAWWEKRDRPEEVVSLMRIHR